MQYTLEEHEPEDGRERPHLDAAMAGLQQLAVPGLLRHGDGRAQVPLLALLPRRQARLEQPSQQVAQQPCAILHVHISAHCNIQVGVQKEDIITKPPTKI